MSWWCLDMRNTIVRSSVAAVLGLGVAVAVDAANWEFAPSLELGYQYNDNYRLDFAGDEVDVSGGLLDVTLPLRLVDPIRRAEIAPRVRATYFPDERDEDSTDYFLAGVFEQRTQRHVFGIDAEFNRQDVVRSDLPTPEIDANLGEGVTADSGRVLLRNERDLLRFDPYWHYDLSERYRTELGGYYLDVNYDKNFDGAQEDFRDYGVYAGWGFRATPRSTVTLRARASRYETTFDADGYGAEVEWRSDYSQTAHIYARIGGQRTDLGRPGRSSSSSIVGGVGGRWDWPTTRLFVDLTSRVGPTAAGEVVERYQVRLRLNRALRPRLSFVGGVRASHDEAVDSDTYPERDYVAGEVGFDFRMTRQWTLLGRYNYIWQEYSDEPSDRSSNAVRIGILYQPGRE